MNKKKIAFLSLSVALMLSLIGGALFGQATQKNNVYRYLSIFTEVFDLVRNNYVEAVPSDQLLDTLCDSSDTGEALTLIVTRLQNGMPYLLATGSYLAVKHGTAEIAFAVRDACQGKGLGTLLLERLAVLLDGGWRVRLRPVD